MSARRLAALERLLAKPDPSDLKPRRHHLTQRGKRDRWVETWVPAVQVWTALRIAEATSDPEDGWSPARHALPIFLTPIVGVIAAHNWHRRPH